MFEFLHLCQFLPISLILPTSSQDRRLRCRVPVAAAQGRAGAVRRGSGEGDDGDQCRAAERPECLGEQ